jgi:glucosamine-phosphate N-acetyltransferase
MNCRLLSLNDYGKGYFELLGQLTVAPKVCFQKFVDVFHKIQNNKNIHIVVIEDYESQIIIGSATIVIEQKFIRDCRCVGHIEDVVVHKDYRKQRLGQVLIQKVVEIGKTLDCYKIILDCSPENVLFYEKCELTKSESHNMVLYL